MAGEWIAERKSPVERTGPGPPPSHHGFPAAGRSPAPRADKPEAYATGSESCKNTRNLVTRTLQNYRCFCNLEVNLVVHRNGELRAFEIKWAPRKISGHTFRDTDDLTNCIVNYTIRPCRCPHGHPIRFRGCFKNWVVTELLKARTNRGLRPDLHFLRDRSGHEIDAVVETGPDRLDAIEMKSGQTVAADFFDGLDYWRGHLPGKDLRAWLVYGGQERQNRSNAAVVPWNGLEVLLDAVRG